MGTGKTAATDCFTSVAGCTTYSAASTCSVCDTGKTLVGTGATATCVTTITNCDVHAAAGTCTTCKTGYTASADAKTCTANAASNSAIFKAMIGFIMTIFVLLC
jgi:hypothetical protein